MKAICFINECALAFRGLNWDTSSYPKYTAQDLDNAKQAAVVGWVKQEDVEKMVARARVGWVEEQEVERRVQAEKGEWERERDTAVRMAEARAAARVGWVEAGEAERRLGEERERFEEEMGRMREVERLRGEVRGLKALVAAKDEERERWEGESIRKAAMWERLVTMGGGVRLVAEGAPAQWKPADPSNSWITPPSPALSSHQCFSSR